MTFHRLRLFAESRRAQARLRLSWLAGAVVTGHAARSFYGANVGCPRDCGSRPAKHQRRLVSGKRRTPADRLDRASRAAGVKILYRSRSGRIRPATTRSWSSRWSPAGFTPWPTGACRSTADFRSASRAEPADATGKRTRRTRRRRSLQPRHVNSAMRLARERADICWRSGRRRPVRGAARSCQRWGGGALFESSWELSSGS